MAVAKKNKNVKPQKEEKKRRNSCRTKNRIKT